MSLYISPIATWTTSGRGDEFGCAKSPDLHVVFPLGSGVSRKDIENRPGLPDMPEQVVVAIQGFPGLVDAPLLAMFHAVQAGNQFPDPQLVKAGGHHRRGKSRHPHRQDHRLAAQTAKPVGRTFKGCPVISQGIQVDAEHVPLFLGQDSSDVIPDQIHQHQAGRLFLCAKHVLATKHVQDPMMKKRTESGIFYKPGSLNPGVRYIQEAPPRLPPAKRESPPAVSWPSIPGWSAGNPRSRSAGRRQGGCGAGTLPV